MKILFFGSKGWIGGMFKTVLDNANVEYVEADCRADNYKDVDNMLKENNPTHIVSFIGRTNGTHNGKNFTTIDYLEQQGRIYENVRDNLFAPIVLARLAEKYSIHLTYLGTGCIFSDSNKSFTESDEPNFFGSSYSVVKGFTDRLMHMYENNVLNLRIRMPISSEVNPRNFITKITTYEKICSIPNSMTVLDELLPLILDMMKNRVLGTINLTNPGVISHNEILEMYRDIVDPYFTWQNFSLEEQSKILAAPRSNNNLDTSRLESMYPNVMNIKDSVRVCISKMALKINRPISVLVTGGYGFIGSNFINRIFDRYKNMSFINIDMLDYCANKESVNKHIREDSRYTSIELNIKDVDIYDILIRHNVKYIVHFAAQSHVDLSFVNQEIYVDDNINATLHLLNAVRRYGKLSKFIHISTDEVYGDYSEEFLDETAMTRPTNPYAASKLGAESMVIAYYHSFNVPIIITRGNNVYGPNQYHEKIIPKFIKLLKNGNKCTIHGAGSVERTFIHVNDTVDAIDVLINKGVVGEIYNIGSYDKMSILELTRTLIRKICNVDDENVDNWIVHISDRPYNDKHYNINFDKLRSLGWEPEIKFNEGLESLINYYK